MTYATRRLVLGVALLVFVLRAYVAGPNEHRLDVRYQTMEEGGR